MEQNIKEAWNSIESNSSVATDEIGSSRSTIGDDALQEAPIGIILCKNADKDYAGYIMQDFRQPMGVATYKTADEMDPELLKALPPKKNCKRYARRGVKRRIKRNTSGAYQGAKYFSCNGKVLDEIRKEKEQTENKQII